MLIWLLQQRRSKEEKCGYYTIKGVIAAADCVLAVFCLRLSYLCGNHLCLVWSSKLLSRRCPAQHKGVCTTTTGARTLRSGLRNYREWLKFWDLGFFSYERNIYFHQTHLCNWVVLMSNSMWTKKPCKKSVAYCLIWNSFWWIIGYLTEEKNQNMFCDVQATWN